MLSIEKIAHNRLVQVLNYALEYVDPGHATPHFLGEKQTKTLQARQVNRFTD